MWVSYAYGVLLSWMWRNKSCQVLSAGAFAEKLFVSSYGSVHWHWWWDLHGAPNFTLLIERKTATNEVSDNLYLWIRSYNFRAVRYKEPAFDVLGN